MPAPFPIRYRHVDLVLTVGWSRSCEELYYHIKHFFYINLLFLCLDIALIVYACVSELLVHAHLPAEERDRSWLVLCIAS